MGVPALTKRIVLLARKTLMLALFELQITMLMLPQHAKKYHQRSILVHVAICAQKTMMEIQLVLVLILINAPNVSKMLQIMEGLACVIQDGAVILANTGVENATLIVQGLVSVQLMKTVMFVKTVTLRLRITVVYATKDGSDFAVSYMEVRA